MHKKAWFVFAETLAWFFELNRNILGFPNEIFIIPQGFVSVTFTQALSIISMNLRLSVWIEM